MELYIVMAIINILGAILLSPIMGATGICLSIFIAYMVRTIGMDIIFYKNLNIDIFTFFKESYIQMAPLFILCMIIGFTLQYIIPIGGWHGLIIKCIIYCASFGVIMYFFSLNQSEKQLLIAPFRKILKK